MAILQAPGVLARPMLFMSQCEDDILLRFTSQTETTNVWLNTHCAIVSFTQNSLEPASAGYFPALDAVKSRVYSLLPNLEYRNLHYLDYYDVPPTRIGPAGSQNQSLVRLGSPADTVWFDGRIGTDGRLELLMLKSSVAGFDSLAAAAAMRYQFRPATARGRPVASVLRFGVPVPRRRLDREPRDIKTETKCECGSSTPVQGQFVYYDEAPEPIAKPAPRYPRDAWDRKVQGKVVLHALVDHTGTPCRVVVVRGVDQLNDAAIEAASRWRFKPARAEGKPVCVWVEIPVAFSL